MDIFQRPLYQWVFLTLLLCNSVETIAQTADQLGRLFSTPRERHELDEIRSVWLQGIEQNEFEPDIVTDDDLVPRPPTDLYLKLEGTVRQADGSHTVWINGDSIPQSLLPDNIRLARVGDLIVLWVNYLDKLFIVRPGQVLHFETETVYEMYQLPPKLAVHFAPPPEEPSTFVGATTNEETHAETTTNSSDMEATAAGIPEMLENISNIAATLKQLQELTQ